MQYFNRKNDPNLFTRPSLHESPIYTKKVSRSISIVPGAFKHRRPPSSDMIRRPSRPRPISASGVEAVSQTSTSS